MKIILTTACVVAVTVPMVATFAPNMMPSRSTIDLYASSDDVPELVKAYAKKGKVAAESSLSDAAPLKSVETSSPALPEPAISVPEMAVDVPAPPAVEVTSEIKAVVKEKADEINAQVASLDIKAQADQINAQFKGMNDFFKATQEQLAARSAEKAASGNVPTLGEMFQQGVVSRRATFTETYTSPIPEGKAPTFLEYIAGGFKSGSFSGEGLADSKAKLALLAENTAELFGKSVTEVDLSKFPDGVSQEMGTGLAVASITLLGIAAKTADTANYKAASAPVTETIKGSVAIEADEDAEGVDSLTGLAKDVKMMALQIKALTQETKDLRKQLKDANDKLDKKELALSKETYKTADSELQLKREIQKINLQLQASENRNKVLEKELAAAKGNKVEEIQIEVPVEIEVAAPSPVKKAPAKKVPAKKSTVKGAATKPVEPKAEVPKAPKAKSKTKATKAKPKKEATKVKVDATKGADWSSLSESTLTKKTVKQLTEYLSDKGVKTSGDDGKPLKKALLVDAVRSL